MSKAYEAREKMTEEVVEAQLDINEQERLDTKLKAIDRDLQNFHSKEKRDALLKERFETLATIMSLKRGSHR